MSRLPRRPAGLPLAGLAAALTAAGLAFGTGLPALAAPAAPAARPAAPPGAVRSSSLASPVRRLLLINGDRLMVTSGPAGRVTVGVRAAAARDAVTSLRFGGQVMEIPTAALPYLGRGLSPSLFRLSALEKAESGGRLPVEVAFSGRRPAIPGLTITRSGAGHAAGYLTAASAREFGAALWRQLAADHARASYGTDGLFGHGVSITLAGSPLTPPARPAFRQHTLTIRGTNFKLFVDADGTSILQVFDGQVDMTPCNNDEPRSATAGQALKTTPSCGISQVGLSDVPRDPGVDGGGGGGDGTGAPGGSNPEHSSPPAGRGNNG